MLNIGSLVIGAIALVLAVFAFIPLLGWANWVIIPFAVIGLALRDVGQDERAEPQYRRHRHRRHPPDAGRRHHLTL
ncbi:hypothetical protein [Sphingopyxis sp. JAI108]|uniref:hypothetical protein n=1 Tax=Sphingopyxis sp. JAI108 TaxID=2723060 RepID=UPI0017EF14E1|nr:hypothetical protein [Sphingopyxis sp. JAI108]